MASEGHVGNINAAVNLSPAGMVQSTQVMEKAITGLGNTFDQTLSKMIAKGNQFIADFGNMENQVKRIARSALLGTSSGSTTQGNIGIVETLLGDYRGRAGQGQNVNSQIQQLESLLTRLNQNRIPTLRNLTASASPLYNPSENFRDGDRASILANQARLKELIGVESSIGQGNISPRMSKDLQDIEMYWRKNALAAENYAEVLQRIGFAQNVINRYNGPVTAADQAMGSFTAAIHNANTRGNDPFFAQVAADNNRFRDNAVNGFSAAVHNANTRGNDPFFAQVAASQNAYLNEAAQGFAAAVHNANTRGDDPLFQRMAATRQADMMAMANANARLPGIVSTDPAMTAALQSNNRYNVWNRNQLPLLNGGYDRNLEYESLVDEQRRLNLAQSNLPPILLPEDVLGDRRGRMRSGDRVSQINAIRAEQGRSPMGYDAELRTRAYTGLSDIWNDPDKAQKRLDSINRMQNLHRLSPGSEPLEFSPILNSQRGMLENRIAEMSRNPDKFRTGRGSNYRAQQMMAMNAGFMIEDFVISSQYGGMGAGIRAATNNVTAMLGTASMMGAFSNPWTAAAVIGGSALTAAGVSIWADNRTRGEQQDRAGFDAARNQRDRFRSQNHHGMRDMLADPSEDHAVKLRDDQFDIQLKIDRIKDDVQGRRNGWTTGVSNESSLWSWSRFKRNVVGNFWDGSALVPPGMTNEESVSVAGMNADVSRMQFQQGIVSSAARATRNGLANGIQFGSRRTIHEEGLELMQNTAIREQALRTSIATANPNWRSDSGSVQMLRQGLDAIRSRDADASFDLRMRGKVQALDSRREMDDLQLSQKGFSGYAFAAKERHRQYMGNDEASVSDRLSLMKANRDVLAHEMTNRRFGPLSEYMPDLNTMESGSKPEYEFLRRMGAPADPGNQEEVTLLRSIDAGIQQLVNQGGGVGGGGGGAAPPSPSPPPSQPLPLPVADGPGAAPAAPAGGGQEASEPNNGGWQKDAWGNWYDATDPRHPGPSSGTGGKDTSYLLLEKAYAAKRGITFSQARTAINHETSRWAGVPMGSASGPAYDSDKSSVETYLYQHIMNSNF